MVGWRDLLFIGGAAVAVGALMYYTKAGEGLKQLAFGLSEVVTAPIRGTARASLEWVSFFGSMREEWEKWYAGLGGLKPPAVTGGCITIPIGEPCPTDQAYVRQNGQCCWSTEIREGARSQPLPPAPVLPIPPPPVVQLPISPEEQACLASTCRDGSRPTWMWGTTCVCP